MDKQLKKEICGKFNRAMRDREAGGRALRLKIQGTTHEARYAAWDEKRSYGTDTRWILLAYGLIKGIPYKAIERAVGERNSAYPYVIAEAAREVAGVRLSGDAILAWLEGSPLPENIFEETAPSPEVKPSVPEVKPVQAPKAGLFSGLKRIFGAAT